MKKPADKFTDPYIRNLKTEKRLVDIREMSGNGFGVRIYATGAKRFFFVYQFDGKRRHLSLGEYPTVTLAEARKRHTAAQGKLDKGIDPLLEKDTEKAERKQMPFISKLCTEYIERHAKRKKKSWEFDEKLLNKEIIPFWKNRKASDIKDRDIKILLNAIVDRGAPVTANRVRALIHMLFAFAIEELILKDNPCTKVKKPTDEKPKDRKLSEAEIKTFWAAMDGEEVKIGPQTRNVLKVILLTAQRPGEVVGMHSREIDGHWWTLPPTRTKNKKEHRVYLTDTVLNLIGDIEGKEYIFPAGRGAEGHMTENALSFALRRNIKGQSVAKDKVKRRKGEGYQRGPYKTEAAASENRIGVEMFTPHDLRRTAATLMAAIKVPFESRERVLNHTLSKMDSTYNQHDFDDEKQMAMESLERRIISITTGSESNVISIQAGRKKAANQ
jgi:integrase